MNNRTSPLRPVGIVVSAVGIVCMSTFFASAATDDQQAEQIETLVRQLNDDSAEARDKAELELLKLAPLDDAEQTDEFLKRLPRIEDGMPEEVKLRLERVRQEIETRQAKETISASRVTLSANAMDLSDVLEAFQEQTGNRLNDFREQFGQDALAKTVTLELDKQEFWPALDKLLDDTQLATYSFSGEEELALVNREPGAMSRYGRGAYAGPFRVEVLNIIAQRNLRNPQQESARLEMEVAWEPRLSPIVISQPVANIEITGDDGQPIATVSPQAVLDVEVPPGSHSTELVIPIQLPARSVKKIDRFKGKISALVPGRTVEFKFGDLKTAKAVEQVKGGVKVVVDRTQQNHGLWEVHMRLEVLSEEAGLESHRSWVFQNITYMVDKDGQEIDHAGMETTIQAEKEVGLAYFFELPADISNYTWVYRTPAAVVRVPVEYELRDLPLP